MKKVGPYHVVVENQGCECCNNGKKWVVVGPDETVDGVSHYDKDNADYEADRMNDAYHAGWSNCRVAELGDLRRLREMGYLGIDAEAALKKCE